MMSVKSQKCFFLLKIMLEILFLFCLGNDVYHDFII